MSAERLRNKVVPNDIGRGERHEIGRLGNIADFAFQLLEARGLTGQVSRIELYGRTLEGIVPCIVYVTPGIQAGDRSGAEALLLSINSVLHEVKSTFYPLRWRFISAFEGNESDQDGQRYLLGDNPRDC